MPQAIKEAVRGVIRRLAERYAPPDTNQLVDNLGRDLTDPNQPKVLVSYLDWRTTGTMLRNGAPHTNFQECNQIVTEFVRRGYAVDVCLCNDAKTVKKDYYDVVFGFGSAWRAACAQNPGARKILYSTENPAWVSLQNETARCDYFAQRHGKRPALERTSMCYEPADYDTADALLSLGEIHYYKEFNGRPLLRLYPTGLVNPAFAPDFSQRKKTSFLVLGADGVVHKGYDLLLEVFAKHPDWELHYYGKNFTLNCRRLGVEIPKNVHDHGFLNIASKAFLAPAAQCGYVLLPSCSEGCPTSILTGMLHGVVPMVMRGNGMDALEEVSYYFSGYHLEEVDADLTRLTQLPDAEYQAMAQKVYDYARRHFTLPDFTVALRNSFDELKL